MIVKIFKTNQIIANIFVVLLSVLMFVPGYFNTIDITTNHHSLVNFSLQNRFVNVLFTSFLVGFQAVFLNFVINEEKLIKGNTHLVGLFYVLLNGSVSALFSINVVLIANTFIITILWIFFKLYALNNAKSLLFNIGLLLGCSVLIYAPLLCLFPLIWIVLSYVRSPNLRDFFISLFGFLLPFIYLIAYLYLTNTLFNSNYVDWIYYPQLFSVKIINESFLYFLGILMLFVMISFFYLFGQIGRDVIKDRKLFIVISLLSLFFVATLIFNHVDYNSLYILMSIPFSVFLANYFNKLKRAWLAELYFTIILLGMLASYFL